MLKKQRKEMQFYFHCQTIFSPETQESAFRVARILKCVYLKAVHSRLEVMAKKIIKFDVEPDYDFELLALVSSVKEYTIAWHLNKVMEVDFYKTEDIEVPHLREPTKYISNLSFCTEYTTYRLVRNKMYSAQGDGSGFVLPEFKNFDYLLKIEGEACSEVANGLPEQLKYLPCVQYFERLKIHHLKSKDNLLF
jgi:hypothetical protein